MMVPPPTTSASGIAETLRRAMDSRAGVAILLALFTALSCRSLIEVADYQSYMLYDHGRLAYAVAAAAAFYLVSFLFVFARFSLGYFVGFCFYAMVLGFLWLSNFSKFHYDHRLAALSAAASAVLFLLPVLLIDAPLTQRFVLSAQNLKRLLNGILLLTLATLAAASFYNFRLISLAHIYDFRDALYFPGPVRYLIGIVTSTLLPFAFASYLMLGPRWKAACCLALMLLFYPVTLSKLALFAPAWAVAIAILSRLFAPRPTTILLFVLPMLFGLVLIKILPSHEFPVQTIFGVINIRTFATPSSAMDIYNDFFSSEPLTHFCQISVVKLLVSCPYQEPLGVVMEKTYGYGNLNASLFATEGIASVGLYFAPLTALVCGFVIAAGNRASAGLPPRFVLLSAALLPQILVNVPLSTALLTHGVAILFALWYVLPREIFQGNSAKTANGEQAAP